MLCTAHLLCFCATLRMIACQVAHSSNWSLGGVRQAVQRTYPVSVCVQMTLNPDCTVVEVPRFAPAEWGNALDWYDATVRACQHMHVLRQCAPASTML